MSKCTSITLANYHRIQEGMTYDEVVRILDRHGEELCRSSIAGYTPVMSSWKNRNGSNMNAMFQNDRLIFQGLIRAALREAYAMRSHFSNEEKDCLFGLLEKIVECLETGSNGGRSGCQQDYVDEVIGDAQQLGKSLDNSLLRKAIG